MNSEAKLGKKYIILEDAAEYLSLKKSTLYYYNHKRVIPFTGLEVEGFTSKFPSLMIS